LIAPRRSVASNKCSKLKSYRPQPPSESITTIAGHLQSMLPSVSSCSLQLVVSVVTLVKPPFFCWNCKSKFCFSAIRLISGQD